ncbi:MAG: hypothetical protein K1X53_13830 [Candidatus Sumerlaeaceae bacterium]|nr:hypothetical protein [Candidatus Sumerlaeaceae bacterium]
MTMGLFAGLIALAGGATEAKSAAGAPELLAPPVEGPLVAAKPDEGMDRVQVIMARKISGLNSVTCDIEMSRKRKNRYKRKVYTGPVEIVRQQGARLAQTRNGKTDEYVVNNDTIWSIDHNEKEAQFIPASVPIVGAYLKEAMEFNIFAAMDQDTLKLRGSQTLDKEPCWVIDGKSPKKLSTVGVPVSKMRVWISQNDGLPRKVNVLDEDDLIVTIRNVKLNPVIPASRFNYSPPKNYKTKNIFGF